MIRQGRGVRMLVAHTLGVPLCRASATDHRAELLAGQPCLERAAPQIRNPLRDACAQYRSHPESPQVPRDPSRVTDRAPSRHLHRDLRLKLGVL